MCLQRTSSSYGLRRASHEEIDDYLVLEAIFSNIARELRKSESDNEFVMYMMNKSPSCTVHLMLNLAKQIGGDMFETIFPSELDDDVYEEGEEIINDDVGNVCGM